MTTVREESVHVVLEKDRHRVVLSVSKDVPFTAASIQATLGALEPYSYGPPDFMWSRMFGLRFMLSLDDEMPVDFDLEAFGELDLPLRVEPSTKEEPLRALFIDIVSLTREAAAVFRPNQVVTTRDLNALVETWVRENELLNGEWFMRQENNCLVVGMRYEPRVVFIRTVDPTYPTTVEPRVYILHDDNGRTGQATVSLRYRLTPRDFELDLTSVPEVPGFGNLSERRRIIRATYTGPETQQLDPELLVAGMRERVLELMRALGVHESLYGEFVVVLDKSGCSAKNEGNLELTRYFPVSSS